ncbi:MAG: hypothetical protein FIA97_20060 [Methylococcaceae bacterium]|nr:hypothetical protein [Methylococcaceae bacterium]
MSTSIKLKFASAFVALPLLVGGCATQQGKDQAVGAAGGAVGGAALGCLTGFIASGSAGGCAKGAAIGGAVGAVAGWGAVKLSQYQAEQVRSAQADQTMYGLTKPVDSVQVKIRKGSSTPTSVAPGDTVKLTTDYSVMLPPSVPSTSVSENWTLKKDGKVLTELPAASVQRAAGGWAADGSIPLPKNTNPGTYVVEHKVKAGSSYDTDESTFVVTK